MDFRGTPVRRNLHFLRRAQAKIPCLFSSTSALRTQKPESRMMYFPVPNYVFNMQSIKPAVLPYPTNSGAFNFRDWSLPSTNSMENMIPEFVQHAVWYSSPNGCGFLGQYTQPGHVHLLYEMDIDSSRQMT